MAADASYASNKLLLHFNGSNGSTSFPDTSPIARAVTAFGNAQISTAQSKFGGASLALDGTGDYIRTGSSADFNLNSGDFCNEFSVRLNSLTGDPYLLHFYGASNQRFALNVTSAGVLKLYIEAGAGGGEYVCSGTLSTGVMYDIAHARAGTTTKVFVNGVEVYSGTPTQAYPNVSCLVEFGAAGFNNSNYANCYVDELRLTKGVARRTAAYTPETEPFADTIPLVVSAIAPTTAFGTPFYVGPQLCAASGFSPTLFGAPVATYDQAQDASGFTTTALGTPSIPLVATGIPAGTQFGTPANIPNALGFRSTQFGTPGTYTTFTGAASGFTSTVVPVPSLPLVASGIASTLHVGTPTTPTNRRLYVTGASTTVFGHGTAFRYAAAVTLQACLTQGFGPSRFGLPYAGPKTARTGIASGLITTAFGTPTALHHRSEAASGFTGTVLGIPAIPLTATGLTPATSFGSATARETLDATGAAPSTQFGTTSVRRIQAATGLYRAARFGTPTCARSNAYIPYGINASGKFGQPTGFSRVNHPATGFTGTQFGTPACALRYRATMTAPATRFGTPLLRRNPACVDRYAASSIGAVTRFGTPSC
jgi:hypothetical protein